MNQTTPRRTPLGYRCGDGVLYGSFNASVRGSNQSDYLLGVFAHGLGSGDGWTAEILFGKGLGLGL